MKAAISATVDIEIIQKLLKMDMPLSTSVNKVLVEYFSKNIEEDQEEYYLKKLEEIDQSKFDTHLLKKTELEEQRQKDNDEIKQLEKEQKERDKEMINRVEKGNDLHKEFLNQYNKMKDKSDIRSFIGNWIINFQEADINVGTRQLRQYLELKGE